MPRWFASYRGRCAAQKKRSATKKQPSPSAISRSPLVLKFARFLFICPVLETLWSPISEIQEGPCAQSTIAQGPFTNNKYSRPAGAGFVSCSRLPEAPAGGARRAGDRLGAWGTTRGRTRRPQGLFGGAGLGRGGGGGRAYTRRSGTNGKWPVALRPTCCLLVQPQILAAAPPAAYA
jgi:hypothetical protein